MPYFIIFIFIITVMFILIFYSKPKKIKINQEIINKYKPMALDIIMNNNEISNARFKNSISNIMTCISFIILPISILLIFQNILFIIITIICVVLLIIFATKDNKKVLYKDIFPLILKSYNKDLEYDHYKAINSKEYSEARYEFYDRYHSEDLITGNISGYPYKMAEVHTESKHRDKDGNTYYTTLFRGAFAKINLKKNFNCNITIVNNKIKLFSRDKYITIDNEAFEKIYDVFTDNKILTMRLLTPDVTSKMIDLYNNTGIYFEIKIFNDIMYIRLYTSKLFELSLSNSEKEAEMIAKSIAQLDSIYTIMNSFINEIERIEL